MSIKTPKKVYKLNYHLFKAQAKTVNPSPPLSYSSEISKAAQNGRPLLPYCEKTA
jgi:hypothetical protein